MTDRLAEHFRLLDDERDEYGDWQPFPEDWVLEGSLITDLDPLYWSPNRWRRAPDRGRGIGVELEVHLTGDRVRLRLPYRLHQLPDDGNERIEENPSGGFQRRWFEQVGPDTQMVIERIK
jgi:hypothetical protein